MMMTYRRALFISGGTWVAMGIFLIIKAVSLLKTAVSLEHAPLLHFFRVLFGSTDEASIAIVILALTIGYVKGRMVLGKTACKTIERLSVLESPFPLSKLYVPRYYAILLVMMCLGFVFRFFSIAGDIRGFIDLTVGSALVHGSLVYFKVAVARVKKATL